MEKVRRYRELAEEMRYRSCLMTDPVAREQLQVAARDFEALAQEAEDKAENER
jgi:hypothetical protein